MPWNKVDTTRAWKKVDVSVNSKNVVKEPFATLCECKGRLTKIYMNCSATSLAKQLGFSRSVKNYKTKLGRSSCSKATELYFLAVLFGQHGF